MLLLLLYVSSPSSLTLYCSLGPTDPSVSKPPVSCFSVRLFSRAASYYSLTTLLILIIALLVTSLLSTVPPSSLGYALVIFCTEQDNSAAYYRLYSVSIPFLINHCYFVPAELHDFAAVDHPAPADCLVLSLYQLRPILVLCHFYPGLPCLVLAPAEVNKYVTASFVLSLPLPRYTTLLVTPYPSVLATPSSLTFATPSPLPLPHLTSP